MGELQRRRSARSLWISQGHLAAIGLVGILSVGLSFGLGYWMGARSSHDTRPDAAVDHRTAHNQEVVDLLARVDANRKGSGKSETLTFPHTLRGEQSVGPASVASTTAEPKQIEPVAVRPGGVDDGVELGQASNARFGLQVAKGASKSEALAMKEALGEQSWLQADLVDGSVTFTVWSQGFEDRELALAALAELKGKHQAARLIDRSPEAPAP